MNKFFFIGGFFLVGAFFIPLLDLWSVAQYFLLARRGTVERRRTRTAVSSGRQGARQVRLVVELPDPFGGTVELRSRTTCKDWVAYDGEDVDVVYDPQAPERGWIKLDLLNRIKMSVFLLPLFLAIAGVLFLIGFYA